MTTNQILETARINAEALAIKMAKHELSIFDQNHINDMIHNGYSMKQVNARREELIRHSKGIF